MSSTTASSSLVTRITELVMKKFGAGSKLYSRHWISSSISDGTWRATAVPYSRFLKKNRLYIYIGCAFLLMMGIYLLSPRSNPLLSGDEDSSGVTLRRPTSAKALEKIDARVASVAQKNERSPSATSPAVKAAISSGHLEGDPEFEKPPLPGQWEDLHGAHEQSSAVHFMFALLAGFCFGFVGSIPVTGPTSVMVLKLGVQGNYLAGQAVAFGGAMAEAGYAGLAFWGFGSFLAQFDGILPFTKVLGASLLIIIGFVLLRLELKLQIDNDHDKASNARLHQNVSDFWKNVLFGLSLSAINPALLGTYTGAIASVHGTGLLRFTKTFALVFAFGVASGISTWFYLLLSLLKKYKQRLKKRTLNRGLKIIGGVLISLGMYLSLTSAYKFFLLP